jgi:hypothetical protein
MMRTGLILLGGLAAMVGGIAWTTLFLLGDLLVRYLSLGSIEKAVQKGGLEFPVFNVWLLGAMAAIVALHVLQRGRYGSRGALASLAAFVGLAMIPVIWLFLVGPSISLALTGAVGMVCFLAATVGMVFLGLATIEAEVLPWWCGAALIVGSPPFAFLWPLVEVPWVGWVGVAWVVVGYAIFRAGVRRPVQPSRVQ